MAKITCTMCANFDEKDSTCQVLNSYVGPTKHRETCRKLRRFVEKGTKVKKEEAKRAIEEATKEPPLIVPDPHVEIKGPETPPVVSSDKPDLGPSAKKESFWGKLKKLCKLRS